VPIDALERAKTVYFMPITARLGSHNISVSSDSRKGILARDRLWDLHLCHKVSMPLDL